MKVLFINNFHYHRGGAETAYFDTAKILKSHGHEVAFFSMQHSENKPTKWEKYFINEVDYKKSDLSLWQKIKIAQKIIFNFQAKKNLEKLIIDFKPDITHLHNIYHHLSPSIIHTLKKYNIPTVLTLHDYKLISPNYKLFLNGKVWEKKSLFACIKDKCVENSYLKSVLCSIEKITHDFLKSYEKIDTFISPSCFLIQKFQEFGFQKEINYLPNPIDIFQKKDGLITSEDAPLIYFGRLSQEKGVDILIQAMKLLEKERLLIVGDGPEKENLLELTKKLKLASMIDFLGFKKKEELKEILRKAKAVIVPSIWYENMPYAVVEALAMGKIIIASGIGGIADLIQDEKNGFLFKAGNEKKLAEKINNLKEFDLDKIKKEAIRSSLKFGKDNYYINIMKIYKKIIYKNRNKLELIK